MADSRLRTRLIVVSFLAPLILFGVVIGCHVTTIRTQNQELDAKLGSWRSQPYAHNSDPSAINQSIGDMLNEATNISLLSDKQKSDLHAQIAAAIYAYSRGDFESYMAFRAPAGVKGDIVWNEAKLKTDKEHLPSDDWVRKALQSGKVARPKAFENYSVKSNEDVAKYTWLIADDTRIAATGYKLYCTDCWTGYSPSDSWVRFYSAPVSAVELANTEANVGTADFEPTVILSPTCKPALFAAVKLAIHSVSPDNAYPVYIVFARLDNPDCWFPVSMAKGITAGTKIYIF